MAKYYYNGILLPEPPKEVLAEYPYCWIRKNTTSGNYDLLFGKAAWCNNTEIYCNDSTEAQWYVIAIEGSETTTEWTYNKTLTAPDIVLGLDSNRIALWTNHDIFYKNSTTLYLAETQPKPTTMVINLVNQNQSSSNNTNSCSLTMAGCRKGNMLILAYAIRGDGNDPTLTSGWTKLGGGNNVSAPTGSKQRLYFAYKIVTTETEVVTITQSPTSRIYMVCSEYNGVSSVQMRDDLSAYGESMYTVTCSKSGQDDVMVYGVTSSYYGEGRNQTARPLDLTKIEGDSQYERLACWFDDGYGELEHTFITIQEGSNDAILECVQLFPKEVTLYQIQSSTLKQFAQEARRIAGIDGSLTTVQMIEIFRQAT